MALELPRPTTFGFDIQETILSDHSNCGDASALTIQVCESGESALVEHLKHEQRASKDNGVLKVMEHGRQGKMYILGINTVTLSAKSMRSVTDDYHSSIVICLSWDSPTAIGTQRWQLLLYR